MAGIVYALLSGQPLCILGGTGPNLAYTVAFYKLCKSLDIEFLPCRVWQGIWCSIITVIFAVTDSCAVMSYVTRYVEEIFAALISLIFIVEALKAIGETFIRRSEAASFLTALLSFGTYLLAMKLRGLKRTTWANGFIRVTVSNFAVTLAIAVATGVAQIWRHVDIEWLQVPTEIVPTLKDEATGEPRPWFINPFGVKKPLPSWAIFAAVLPGLGMAVLLYLDQNLTSLLINRPTSGIRKPVGYHLDLFVCGVIIFPICSFLGLPFPCAATVRSVTHLISLTTYEERPVPGGGVQKVASKVVEQRWTHFAIHVLIGFSLLLSKFLSYIPKGVLFGVFLYMGVTSVAGNQLFERLFLWGVFDASKYPRLPYVTRLRTRRLHLFTAVQFLCLVILYALKAVKQTAVAFPFFIAFLIFVRIWLKHLFTEQELAVLDAHTDLPPDPVKKGADAGTQTPRGRDLVFSEDVVREVSHMSFRDTFERQESPCEAMHRLRGDSKEAPAAAREFGVDAGLGKEVSLGDVSFHLDDPPHSRHAAAEQTSVSGCLSRCGGLSQYLFPRSL
uniref:Bicarbonate transporter-like transmembrane domain-containing protein n=1 Tax=Alexandrium monilatum TaxID=311494 RepID=A0A7S4T8Q7_9DINO